MSVILNSTNFEPTYTFSWNVHLSRQHMPPLTLYFIIFHH